MHQGQRPVFEAGQGERPPVGVFSLHASEGREAAWMAAGAAAVTGSPGVVVAHSELDRVEAASVARRATVPILVALGFEEASGMLAESPGVQIACDPSEDVAEWLLAELVAALPAGGILFTEDAFAGNSDAVVSALVPGARGHGVAAAVGAKAARPERAVLALVGEDSFSIGASALGVAARCGLGLGIVVRAERPDARCDLIAEALGAHGEMVEDPSSLRLHLHNALASRIPSVLSLGINRRRAAARA